MQSDLQKQALEYMAVTQPLIAHLTAGQTVYRTKAAEIGPVFVETGLIARNDQKKFTEKLASDPSVALEYLLKLAGMLASQDSGLGEPSKIESSVNMDAFQRWAAYGDPNANPSASRSTV